MFEVTDFSVLCPLHIACLENNTIYTAPVRGWESVNVQFLYIQVQTNLSTVLVQSHPGPKHHLAHTGLSIAQT
jgi:hypothetical protein